jgi:hypothetical protein
MEGGCGLDASDQERDKWRLLVPSGSIKGREFLD